MSQSVEDEDSVLKDLVSKALQNNGALGNIKAQLRASVFLSLEEDFKDRDLLLCNQHARKILSSPAGVLAASLVHDFLTCLGLDFSLSVYAPESNLTAGFWKVQSRDSLLKLLGFDQDKDASTPVLLSHCRRQQQQQHQHSTETVAKKNKSSPNIDSTTITDKLHNNEEQKSNTINTASEKSDSHTVNGTSASTPDNKTSKASSISPSSTTQTSKKSPNTTNINDEEHSNNIRNTNGDQNKTSNNFNTDNDAGSVDDSDAASVISEDKSIHTTDEGVDAAKARRPPGNILDAPPLQDDDETSSSFSSTDLHGALEKATDRLWTDSQNKRKPNENNVANADSTEDISAEFSLSSTTKSRALDVHKEDETVGQTAAAAAPLQQQETTEQNTRQPMRVDSKLDTQKAAAEPRDNIDTDDDVSLQDLWSSESSSYREETEDMTASSCNSAGVDYQEQL